MCRRGLRLSFACGGILCKTKDNKCKINDKMRSNNTNIWKKIGMYRKDKVFLRGTCVLIRVEIIHMLKLKWTDCIMDRILKKVEVGKFITTALKSILKLVKLQSLVAKCCKMRKI